MIPNETNNNKSIERNKKLDDYLKHTPTPIVLYPEGTRLRQYIFQELRPHEQLSNNEVEKIIKLGRKRHEDYINRIKNLNSSFSVYKNISASMSKTITTALQKYISKDLACGSVLKTNVHATGYPEYLREHLLVYLDAKS